MRLNVALWKWAWARYERIRLSAESHSRAMHCGTWWGRRSSRWPSSLRSSSLDPCNFYVRHKYSELFLWNCSQLKSYVTVSSVCVICVGYIVIYAFKSKIVHGGKLANGSHFVWPNEIGSNNQVNWLYSVVYFKYFIR